MTSPDPRTALHPLSPKVFLPLGIVGPAARLGVGLRTALRGSHDGPQQSRTHRKLFIQAGLRSLLQVSSLPASHGAGSPRSRDGLAAARSVSLRRGRPSDLLPSPYALRASGPLLRRHLGFLHWPKSEPLPPFGSTPRTSSRPPSTWSPFTPLPEAGPAPRIAPEDAPTS